MGWFESEKNNRQTRATCMETKRNKQNIGLGEFEVLQRRQEGFLLETTWDQTGVGVQR